MTKKTIALDFDNVICEEHFFYPLNCYLEATGRKALGSLDDYHGEGGNARIGNFINQKDMDDFFEYYLNDNTYKGAKPIPGALSGVEKLCKHFDVFIITATERARKFAREFADKFNWMLDYMPFFNPRKIIMANDKSIINADIIIDDRLRHLTDNYKTKILFTAYHNKKVTQAELDEIGAVRVSGWEDLVDLLMSFVS